MRRIVFAAEFPMDDLGVNLKLSGWLPSKKLSNSSPAAGRSSQAWVAGRDATSPGERIRMLAKDEDGWRSDPEASKCRAGVNTPSSFLLFGQAS